MSKHTLIMRHIDTYGGVASNRTTLVELRDENADEQVAKVEISGAMEFVVAMVMHDPFYRAEELVKAVQDRLEGYETVGDAFDDLGEPEVYVEMEE
ncbi:MAG TPA: hypothetical protein H9899_07065 [Candidatus Sphingomonas excrementigallinarum]|nr:hypothetical protein [Candidatus Sphingomonas excrementigallinarum]